MFVDSKGRVWMMPYTNQICYYFKGKIYNAQNDTILRKFVIKSFINYIIEDNSKNLIFAEPEKNMFGLSDIDKIYHFRNINADFYSMGIGNKMKPQIFLSEYKDSINKSATQLFDILFTKDSIKLSKANQKFNFLCDNTSEVFISPSLVITTNRRKEKSVSTIIKFQINDSLEREINKNRDYNNLFVLNDSIVFINTKSGTVQYNYLKQLLIKEFLKSENISSCFLDNEKNIWFTSLNHGVFRLYSNPVINFTWKNKNNYFQSITSIGGNGKDIFLGNVLGDFYGLNKCKGNIIAQKEMSVDFLKGMNQKIKYKKNKLVIFDQMTFSVFSNGELKRVKIPNDRYFSIKDFELSNNDRLYIAYHSGACYGDLIKKSNRFYVRKFVYFYKARSTSIAIGDSLNYLGTLTGLKCFNSDGVMKSVLPDLPLLKVGINNLVFQDGLLWIGTNQHGVICFDGKEIVKNITVKDGLPENSIRCLYLDNKKLWVGTNKGITEIAFEKLNNIRVARNFNNDEGLISNVVNDIYTANDSIYVATEEGLSIITDLQPKQTGVCILNTPIVRVASKIVSAQNVSLNPGDDIQFEYTGISFRSEGDISYKYRLLGIDSVWKITNQRFIYYSFLPNGNYNLQLLAVNKFGIKSKLINVPFRVNKRLYEENYFRIIICLIIISLISLLFKKRNQVNQKKYLQKLQNAQKIMSLEQEALKAQMNPHFIFNCLNAIQYFIIEKDVISANKFISSFAGLIRQALDNSGRKSISIEEEITFLKSFIEIEQNRFEDRFLYQINVSDDIETDLLQIPPMLVQPFVENAINHGLLHKKNGIGKLEIYFSLSEEMLKIIISDNGIGRTASRSLSNHVELRHVSKGIALTEMRISRLNFSETNKIKLAIEDQYDNNGNSIGTQVEILIPLIFDN
jgi:hypothetical protein